MKAISIMTSIMLMLPSTIVATPEPEALLLARQAPGTPQYDCHAACGGVISQSRREQPSVYCASTNFTQNLSACLACAETYKIWEMYGRSVGSAAQNCNITAVPIPASSNGTNSTTTPRPNATTSGSATSTTGSSSASKIVEHSVWAILGLGFLSFAL